MKIRVLIPLWKRPEVTKFCFGGLQKLIAETKHTIDVLCVISENEYIPICEEKGFHWTYYKNDPLGEKINAGVKVALGSEWDYLMVMNSDDVILTELLDRYYDPFFEKMEPFFGIDKVTYVKFGTTEAVEIKYDFTVLGIGKCIRRDIVERAMKERGCLYIPARNKGLDDTMFENLMRMGITHKIVKYQGMLAMDFKSDVNIHSWEKFKDKGKKLCYNLGYGVENLIEN